MKTLREQWFYWGVVSVSITAGVAVLIHLQLWVFAVLYRLAFYFNYLP